MGVLYHRWRTKKKNPVSTFLLLCAPSAGGVRQTPITLGYDIINRHGVQEQKGRHDTHACERALVSMTSILVILVFSRPASASPAAVNIQYKCRVQPVVISISHDTRLISYHMTHTHIMLYVYEVPGMYEHVFYLIVSSVRACKRAWIVTTR